MVYILSRLIVSRYIKQQIFTTLFKITGYYFLIIERDRDFSFSKLFYSFQRTLM